MKTVQELYFLETAPELFLTKHASLPGRVRERVFRRPAVQHSRQSRRRRPSTMQGMTEPSPFLPAPSAASDPVLQEVLDVLAVCPRGQTLQDVRALIAQWPVPARVRWTSDPVDALRLAITQRPALVLVDARLDRAGGRALVNQFARWRADLDVFAFDERHHHDPRSQPSLWHWSELPRVLRWWVQRHLCQAPLFNSLPSGLDSALMAPGQAG